MSALVRVISSLAVATTLAFILATPIAPTVAQTDPLSEIGSVLSNVANAPPAQAQEQESAPSGPIVRAFMFTKAGCLHCDEAKREILPPVKEMFGPQLDLRYVYADDKMGVVLYDIAITHYGIDDPGVPMIIMGDQRFQGTEEIRTMFPVAVASYLSQGGVDWPDMPGLEYAIPEAGPENGTTSDPAEGAASAEAAEPIPTAEPSPTMTVQPTATAAPTPTAPPPTPTPAPEGRFGGCFGSIALGLVAVGVVLMPRARSWRA